MCHPFPKAHVVSVKKNIKLQKNKNAIPVLFYYIKENRVHQRNV